MKHVPLAIFVLLGCCLASAAARAGAFAVEITPAQPTTDDIVRVTVSGTWGTTCFNVSSDHEAHGSQINIVGSVNQQPYCQNVCNDVITPWSFQREIGNLPAGEYEVETSVYFFSCPPDRPSEFVQTTTFEVVAPGPGRIAPGIRLGKSSVTPGRLEVSWPASCSTAVTDYGIYEGMLGSFSSHGAIDCNDDLADYHEEIDPDAGDAYYLVVPRIAAGEGSYGTSSTGVERPPAATAACAVPQIAAVCL